MHICYLSQEYPPETGWGGIGSYTYEMAHGLVRAGHRVTVISLALGAETVVDDGGVEVHRVLPAPQWERWRGLWRLNHVWPGFAWAAMQRFRAIHRRHPVAVVEAPEGRADSLFIGLLPGRPPLVVRLHTARIFVDRMNKAPVNNRSRYSYFVESVAIRQADQLTAPSRAIITLTNTWLSLNKRHVAVIANPISTKDFSTNPEGDQHEALFVGRLERNKGVDALCYAVPRVLSKLENVSFRFVGQVNKDEHGVSWKDKILAMSPPALHPRIHFEHLPRAQIRQAYARAAVAVLPSHWENFPYTALEAMASGKPVIATSVGGFPEIVEPGVSGLLVPVDDPQALANAMYTLLADPTRAAQMGRAARTQAVERFDTSRVIPHMLELYSSARAWRRQ